MKQLLVVVILFCALPLRAQEEVVREATRLLNANRNTYPAMRPLVFFSQDKYAAGDTAFFRMFILTESERILADRSLFTIELVNGQGKVVIRQMVPCQPFGAANQLILPGSMDPGNYEVRLFSDRMTTAYGLTTSLLIVGTRQLVQARPATTRLSFHPEGGHLVPGVLNRVLVKAEGRVPEAASLFSKGGRILTVEFDHGLASLLFIPLPEEKYRVDYVAGGEALSADLPPVEREAVTLRVYPGPKKTWVVDISAGPRAPRKVYFFLVAARQIVDSREIRFSNEGKANLLVADGFFPEGFSELFLLDDELKPLAYRPVYIPARPQASVSIGELPETVGLRTDVPLSLTVTDGAGLPIRSSLTVSVIPEETRLRTMRTPDPTLELRNAPSPVDLAAPATRIEHEVLAGFDPPSSFVPNFPVLLHSGSLSLSGKVYSPDPQAPLPYLSRIVIYLHNDLIQYETTIDGTGNFHFEKIYDFMGDDKVFYKVINQRGQTLPAKVDWSMNLGEEIPVSVIAYEESSAEDLYGVLRARKKAIDRSFRYFLKPDSLAKGLLNYSVTLEEALHQPDITVRPGDYVPFETMRELILEVIPLLKFRVHGKDSVVEVTLTNNNPAFVPMRYAEGNPLYVIDGYMTTNTRYLMSLSPQDIETVKIINDIGKLDKLQNLARDGVLFIQTRMPERTRADLEKELYPIAGLSPTLGAPLKYPAQKRVPDLRSLLYWTPLTDTDSTGRAHISFRTSDLPGYYWIRIMGVTETGHLFSTEKRMEVSFK